MPHVHGPRERRWQHRGRRAQKPYAPRGDTRVRNKRN
jgi:hypothetical protein